MLIFVTGFYKNSVFENIEVVATITQDNSDGQDLLQAKVALQKLNAIFEIKSEN